MIKHSKKLGVKVCKYECLDILELRSKNFNQLPIIKYKTCLASPRFSTLKINVLKNSEEKACFFIEHILSFFRNLRKLNLLTFLGVNSDEERYSS